MPADHSTPRRITIYFIQYGEAGPIKIGRTDGDPLRRLKGMQTGAPEPLRLLATIAPARACDELDLHRKFAHLRIRGEWFEPAPELLDFLKGGAPASTDDGSSVIALGPLRGRIPVAFDPVQRRRHIKAATYRLVQGKSPRWIARKFRVSLRTVNLWVLAAQDYDDPEAELLRATLDQCGQAAATG